MAIVRRKITVYIDEDTFENVEGFADELGMSLAAAAGFFIRRGYYDVLKRGVLVPEDPEWNDEFDGSVSRETL